MSRRLERSVATSAGDAQIVTHPRYPERSSALSERIELPVKGVSSDALRSVVANLVLRDVPTVVWWTASKLTTDPNFAALTELATSVVVDSSGGARDDETIAQLADFAGRFPNVAIRDLAFLRLAPWQETIAQFFDDPDLFKDIFSISRPSSYRVQMAMRLGRAHPLIPQMHRQLELRAKAVGKCFCRNRPWATIAGKMNRPSDHNPHTGIAPQQSSDRAQIIACVGMDDGQQGLRGQSQLV